MTVGCRSSSSKTSPSASPPPSGSAPTASNGDSNGDQTRRPPPPPRRRAPPPPPTVNCGRLTPYDTDGDGISDPVENNNGSNNYADLKTGRCDRDPSGAQGKPAGGGLKGSLNLPDTGDGYRHYYGTDSVDTDDWGTLKMLSCIEAVGRAVKDRGIRMGVGDLSIRGGGPFPPHRSHQNGLDADLRYVRRDRKHIPLDLRFEPEAYDLPATKTVFEAFFEVCNVEVMFVDTDRIGFTVDGQETRIIHVGGHSNHFHVRIGGS